MGEPPLQREISHGVALLRLNRPQVLNALDEALVSALLSAVEAAARDEAIRCLVLTGSGRAFSAGGDLTAMLSMSAEQFRHLVALLQRLSATMRAQEKPSIAAVNGYALAGGFELAILCDLRIASEDALFGLPDTALGLSPTSGMTYLLPRIVGMGWAKHLALTGERITAQQAEQIGLVTRVVPTEQLEQVALQMARTIASFPPLALRYVKHGFDRAAESDLQTTLESEIEAEMACFAAEELHANLRAFAERKRAERHSLPDE